MHKLRYGCSKNRIKIDMFISIGQPFLSSHYMSNLHLPVINNISKMESRPPIFSHYDKIIQILKFQHSKNLIYKSIGHLLEVTFNSNCILLFIFYFSFDLLKGQISTGSRIGKWLFLTLLLMLFFTETWKGCPAFE